MLNPLMHWRDCHAETLAWFQLRELFSMMAVMARAIEDVLHLVNPISIAW
jgi:hypothetical protein